MAERMFARLGVVELEKLFDEKRTNFDVLTSLLAELSHRRTSRAKALRKRVVRAMAVHAMAKPDGR